MRPELHDNHCIESECAWGGYIGRCLKRYDNVLSCADVPSLMADMIPSFRSVYLLDLCMHRRFSVLSRGPFRPHTKF